MGLEEDQKRCLEKLIWAIEQLQGNVDLAKLSKTAELIIHTMTGPWRFFHTPEHIFEVGGSVDAIEVLAALFHDLVYVQVDQGVSVNISSYISPYVKEVGGHLIIRDLDELPSDRLFDMTAAIFGFVPGQVLSPMAGQNEFLSAVISTRSLQSLLEPSILAEIATCIEATIPFRPRSETGLTAGDRLYQRLVQVNQDFDYGWSETKVEDVLRRAIRLANRDVENFAYPSSADFLDNTWNLMPETNHDLKNANSYTVHGYRVSLQKMEGFMNFLKPDLVFQQFRGEPEDAMYQQLVTRTQKNLDIAKLYLGIKLVSIAIIEALSSRIGRDIPLSTMMGELPSQSFLSAQLENFLPDVVPNCHQPETPLEKEVMDLLAKGRTQTSTYDIKNSPVATYMVRAMGFDKMRYLIQRAKQFFKGEITAEDFLASCDPEVNKTVTDGVLQLFESRKAALERREFKPVSA